MLTLPVDISKISPEGIICVMFQEKGKITFNYSDFYRAFFEAKQSGEYKEILRDIRFSGSPINPYSEELYAALSNVQYAGALSRRNPDMVEYLTTSDFGSIYELMLEDVSPATLGEVKTLCEEILHKLKK